MEYRIKRSKRKSISLEVTSNGQLLVRAPYFMSHEAIDFFVEQKRVWVEKALLQYRSKPKNNVLSVEECHKMRKTAKQVLPERLRALSEQYGFTYRSVRITSAKKRFGSCSSQNHICFPFWLILLPDELIDFVILHELCHTRVHNHSLAFYTELERYLPDWHERHKQLKEFSLPVIGDR